ATMFTSPIEWLICLIPWVLIGLLAIWIISIRRNRNKEIAAGGGTESEINYQAQIALINAMVGTFFFGIILGPFAWYRASKAIRLIREHNIGQEHANKARAAQIIAIIDFCLWLLICSSWLFAQR
ncbi:MAG: hypothetical protein L6300_16290, partial [Syntrophaceae bacterium]|nr:hypothetical protein [Syntrophaceae bacterium]